MYDSQGRHTGFQYSTGQIEIGIPGSSYSGASSAQEWITVSQPDGGPYRIVVVAINTDGGQDYGVSILETPQLPALLNVPPTVSLEASKIILALPFTLPLQEYGGFVGVSSFGFQASNLVSAAGDTIPASLIQLALPEGIGPGQVVLVQGKIRLDLRPSTKPGMYSGTIFITGNDGQTGAPISENIKVQLIITQQEYLFLPLIKIP